MEYTLIRSKRHTMAIEIQSDGSVLVRVPLLCPKGNIDRFVKEHESWIISRRNAQIQKQSSLPAPLSTEEEEQLRRMAKSVLPGLVTYYAKRMNVPVPPVRITSARTRYGSCSAKNVISFSKYLMANSQDAIDYVVVHELAHIRNKNHGKAFWNEVAAVLPDWKERRKSLFMPQLEEKNDL